MNPDQLAVIKTRAQQYANAIGPGGERAWLAGLLAADMPALLAALAAVEQDRDKWRNRCDGQAWADLEQDRDRLQQLVDQYAPIAVPILADIKARKERAVRMAAHTHYCWTCSDGTAPGDGCHNCRNTGMDQTPCVGCPGPQSATGHGPTDVGGSPTSSNDQGPAVGAERDEAPAADEPDLIIYQAWDTDEIGWSDDNGMSGTDVEAVKLGALESFVAWSSEENWCGDPDEVERFEAELREGLHWRQIGKAWELHRGTQPKQGNSTWQGITIFTMKVSRDTVADVEAKCAKARAEHGGEADRRG